MALLLLYLISTVHILQSTANKAPCSEESDKTCTISPSTYIPHHSWTVTEENSSSLSNLDPSLEVPIYDILEMDMSDVQVQSEIYDLFFNSIGALIVRGAYSKDTMRAYNEWCEGFLDIALKDGNCRHPKQKKKIMINDVISRLGKDDPDLLMKLINNEHLTTVSDVLLGFMKYGSVTTHWIEAGGDRQQSHVDFPIHVGSGPFWENDVNKLMKLTTSNQINNILPFYSIQILIASDKMNVSNGATELVPSSHLIPNIDLLIHDKEKYDEIEPFFKSVDLQQGDFLIFNRRLIHRGGKNLSDKRRNSLILQCVWLWGIGQEIIEYDQVLEYVKDSNEFQKLDQSQKETFLTRLKAPYPMNVKKST